MCFARYEIEYDENRLQIGRDIGHRFLGIECGGGDGGLLMSNGGAGLAECVAAAAGSCDTAAAAADAGDETDSGIVTKEPRENGGVNGGPEDASDGLLLLDDADELVLDVLNDDLIAHVKEKITRKDCILQNIFGLYLKNVL